MDPFLKETRYCDYNHPSIQKVAKEFRDKY